MVEEEKRRGTGGKQEERTKPEVMMTYWIHGVVFLLIADGCFSSGDRVIQSHLTSQLLKRAHF